MGIAGGDNNIQPVNTGEIEIDPGRCFQAKVDGQVSTAEEIQTIRAE